jgi:hypothetical protein
MDQIVVVGLGLSELVALSGHVMTGEIGKMKLVWVSDFQGSRFSALSYQVSRCRGVQASTRQYPYRIGLVSRGALTSSGSGPSLACPGFKCVR